MKMEINKAMNPNYSFLIGMPDQLTDKQKDAIVEYVIDTLMGREADRTDYEMLMYDDDLADKIKRIEENEHKHINIGYIELCNHKKVEEFYMGLLETMVNADTGDDCIECIDI